MTKLWKEYEAEPIVYTSEFPYCLECDQDIHEGESRYLTIGENYLCEECGNSELGDE